MNMHAGMQGRRPIWFGALAVFLAGGVAVGYLALSALGAGTAFGAGALPAAEEALSAIAARPAPGYGCDECGMIAHTRQIDAADAASESGESGESGAAGAGRAPGAKLLHLYEITIRLQDGSMHVVTDAHPAHWRAGERVILIAGKD